MGYPHRISCRISLEIIWRTYPPNVSKFLRNGKRVKIFLPRQILSPAEKLPFLIQIFMEMKYELKAGFWVKVKVCFCALCENLKGVYASLSIQIWEKWLRVQCKVIVNFKCLWGLHRACDIVTVGCPYPNRLRPLAARVG